MAFEEQVARGIALLDQKVPGWRDWIDLDRLDMRSVLYEPGEGCGCILAQLYGDYDDGLYALELDDTPVEPYGFDTSGDRNKPGYAALTNAWKRALTRDGAS